jgi:hypothetical protein
MKLTKEPAPSSFKAKSYKTTYVWAVDGWVYDVVARTRMQFFSGPDGLQMNKESWSVLQEPLFTEEVEVHVLDSHSWIESGELFTIEKGQN